MRVASCLIFQEINDTSNTSSFIKFTNDGDQHYAWDGCWSYVGEQGGEQVRIFLILRNIFIILNILLIGDQPGSWLHVWRHSDPWDPPCSGIRTWTEPVSRKYFISIKNVLSFIFLRPDRDEYVKINWENIEPGKEANFEKRTETGTTEYMSYDFYSIMHYGSSYFSTNGQNTIGKFINRKK